MSMQTKRAFAMASVLVACKSAGPTHEREHLRVAAASDLTVAFAEVGTAFEKQGGPHVDFTFGASGMLARQVEEGAPFDVFAAANVSFVDEAVQKGACLGDSRSLYARGRIVMWADDANRLPADLTELADPKYAKIALANPEHAPYGRAAREALVKAGVWPKIEGRIVYGENVQQALTFAKSGNADVAIVAHSLVTDSPGHTRPIDVVLYAPIHQAIVVCKGTNGSRTQSHGAQTNARAFVDFVGKGEGREILRRHGFALP